MKVMVRLYIEMDEADRAEFIRKAKAEGKTYRQKVLDDANISYKKRSAGRPSLDQITAKLDQMRVDYRLFEQEQVAQGLKVKTDADGLSAFEIAQRRRKEAR